MRRGSESQKQCLAESQQEPHFGCICKIGIFDVQLVERRRPRSAPANRPNAGNERFAPPNSHTRHKIDGFCCLSQWKGARKRARGQEIFAIYYLRDNAGFDRTPPPRSLPPLSSSLLFTRWPPTLSAPWQSWPSRPKGKLQSQRTFHFFPRPFGPGAGIPST